MIKKKPQSRKLRNLIWWLMAAVLVSSAAGITIYSAYLAKRIDKRFATRRWNIPSKVYSDSTLLYRGQTINRTLLRNKLRRLGY